MNSRLRCKGCKDFFPREEITYGFCGEACKKEHRTRQRRRTQQRYILDIERARGLYDEGKSLPQIVDIIGGDTGNLSRALRKAGVVMRSGADYYNEIDEDEAVRLYVDEEYTPEAIAKTLEVGATRIREVLTSRSVMRPPGRRSGEGPARHAVDSAIVTLLYTERRLSVVDIAKETGYPAGAVRRVLKQLGIMRPPGGTPGKRTSRTERRKFKAEFRAARHKIRQRSNGQCEIRVSNVCTGRLQHVHHRKLRSRGGDNMLENLLAACSACHQYAHSHPEESKSHGVIVSSWDNPSVVPVVDFKGSDVELRLESCK